jgi:hypothetical protein
MKIFLNEPFFLNGFFFNFVLVNKKSLLKLSI